MIAVAPEAEIGEGQVLLLDAGERQVLLTRHESEILATEPRCPHARSVLGPGLLAAGGLIECPMHGALFSPRDGVAHKGPTCEGLETYPVEVREGTVYVDFEAARPRPPASLGPTSTSTAWGDWSAASAG